MNTSYLFELFKIIGIVVFIFIFTKYCVNHLVNEEPLKRIPTWYIFILIIGSLVGVFLISLFLPDYLGKTFINFWDKFITTLIPTLIGLISALYKHYKITV